NGSVCDGPLDKWSPNRCVTMEKLRSSVKSLCHTHPPPPTRIHTQHTHTHTHTHTQKQTNTVCMGIQDRSERAEKKENSCVLKKKNSEHNLHCALSLEIKTRPEEAFR